MIRRVGGGLVLWYFVQSYLFEAFLVVLSHSCFLTSIPSNSPSPDSGGETMVINQDQNKEES